MHLVDILFRRSKPTRERRTDKRLLFLHVPKTAGTSLTSFLRQRFAAGDSIWLNHEKAIAEGKWTFPETPRSCYVAHAGYGLLHHLPANTVGFTILRNPVERALSMYHYCRGLPRKSLQGSIPVLAAIHDMSLSEFLHAYPEEARFVFGNMQTDMFSASGEPFTRQIGRKPNLARAKENLAKCLVGLKEHLEESIHNLCEEFGWPRPDCLPTLNQTQNRPKVFQIDSDVQAWMDEHTALDAELYRFGKTLFEEWSQRIREQRAKGPPDVPEVGTQYRLTFNQPIPGYGWHPRESFAGRYFCWCPQKAWLRCPAPAARRLRVEIDTLTVLSALDNSFTLNVNGQPVELQQVRTEVGVRHVGTIPAFCRPEFLRLDFLAKQPVRPCEVVAGSTDTRLLGMAVHEVSLRAA